MTQSIFKFPTLTASRFVVERLQQQGVSAKYLNSSCIQIQGEIAAQTEETVTKELGKKVSSPIQMYLYARFMGFKGSIVECDQWAQQQYKKPNTKKARYFTDKRQNGMHKPKQCLKLTTIKPKKLLNLICQEHCVN
jgi:hypothetical protein